MDWILAAWRDQSSAADFAKRPGWYQAMIVSAFRVERQIEGILAEDRDIRYKQEQAMHEAASQSKVF